MMIGFATNSCAPAMLIVPLFAGLLTFGCTRERPRDFYFENTSNINSLEQGLTPDRVEMLAGKEGAFEFLTEKGGDSIKCILYYFDAPRYRAGSQYTHAPFVKRLFVFRDGRLDKVCSLPRRGSVIETDEEGRRRTRTLPVDPLVMINSVLGNIDVLGTESMVPAPLAEPHPPDRPGIPWWSPVGLSFWSAVAIGTPISEIREAPKRREIRRRSLLAREKYDPTTLSMGQPRRAVEEQFGEPIRCEPRGDLIAICVYGDPEISQEKFALAIRYESNLVAGVYCDEFFPTAWLPAH